MSLKLLHTNKKYVPTRRKKFLSRVLQAFGSSTIGNDDEIREIVEGGYHRPIISPCG